MEVSVNELTTIPHEPRPLDAYRMSTDAAGACRDIVVATASEIQGRRFVSVEGWQAIAIAHGCTAGSRDVERVEGGVRAIGEVRRMSDGGLIATAEGFVGEDEPTWFGGKALVWDKQARRKVEKDLPKRADYAIRAMAQTRAISRACRSAFAHVVVMMNAGLATTPAEEVPQDGFDPQTGEIIEATVERPKVPGISKIKERLNAFMRAGDACTDLETFRKMVHDNRADIKTIRDANHEYWTGDGNDWKGFGKWMEGRYAALTPKEESLAYQLLVSTLQEVSSTKELQAWLNKNGDVVGDLDGEEARKFEEIYDTTERALKAAEVVRA